MPKSARGRGRRDDLGAGALRELAAKRIFHRIDECNRASVATTGEIDTKGISAIIRTGLADPALRSALIIALAEFVGTALDGTVLELSAWAPRATSRHALGQLRASE